VSHKDEAERLLDVAAGYVSKNMVELTGEYKYDVLSTALVEATLELADQQRATNSIAYFRDVPFNPQNPAHVAARDFVEEVTLR